MSSFENQLLSKGQLVNDIYKVGFLVQADEFNQTYRAVAPEGVTKLLRIFNSTDKAKALYDSEKVLLDRYQSRFVPQLYETGAIEIKGESYSFLLQSFVPGESLESRLDRVGNLSIANIRYIANCLLAEVSKVATSPNKLVLNRLTPSSVWIDMSHKDEQLAISNLLFGHERNGTAAAPFLDKDCPYIATEVLGSNQGSHISDLFSISVLLYRGLYGRLPWNINEDSNDLVADIKRERQSGIYKPDLRTVTELNLFDVIRKGLDENPRKRYQTAYEFLKAIDESGSRSKNHQSTSKKLVAQASREQGDVGFAAIAGMDQLKATIQTDVIDALNERDRYQEYGLEIPNGLLLYGPPGCGKTFFAEKMAEEIDFNFYKMKPSDIQSKWVNATQENVRNMFEEARKNSPSILFIDEIDAIVPCRDNERVSHMNTSAVNEFLAQMNNCGSDGVFVIAATNIPQSIDPAVLRTGRIDKKVYVSTPDKTSRIKLFEKILCGRPMSNDIDLELLSLLTDGYVASDIKFVCDEASRSALKRKDKISQDDLLQAIRCSNTSIIDSSKYLPMI